MVIDGISRQLVEDANAGIFIEPENAGDFADKVKYYINHPHLLSGQGENGYQYAKVHFDRDILAKKYLNYLEDYLSQNPEPKKSTTGFLIKRNTA